MWAIIKKEFKTYFTTPIGYIFISMFLLAFSVSFYFIVINFGTVNFEAIYFSLPTILVLAFILPLLTMRTFAEERKSGTDQLLLTSPVSITKIVLGKFVAAALIVIITEILTLMYFGILTYFGMPHISTALTTMLGFLLFTMLYVAFGLFASSITENQIVAGIITIGFFIITWILPEFSRELAGFSFINMFHRFSQGQIDIANTVTFVTFTIAFVLLTIIALQRRKSVK